LIDFTLKWRPLEELDSLRPMLKVQLQYAAKVVAVARDIIRRWEITDDDKWNVLGWIDDVVGAKWGRNRT